MKNVDAIKSDIVNTLKFFPDYCLTHFLENTSRLIRGAYRDGKGGVCIMSLLSEMLPASRRICSRETLTTFFTGGHGPGFREQEVYQSPRWIVRAWDGHVSSIPDSRYGDIERLDVEIVIETGREELASHKASRHERVAV